MAKFSLLFTDVVRFFHEQQFEGGCPVCAATGWSISSMPESDDVNLFEVPLHGTTQALITVAMTCNKCGWIRMHNASHINDWVQENPEQPSAKPEGAAEADGKEESQKDE